MHQSSRVQRLTGTFVRDLSSGEPAKLAVDEREVGWLVDIDLVRVDRVEFGADVTVRLAVGVRHIAAVTLDEDERAFLLEAVEVLIGVQDVVMVLLPELLGVEAVANLVQQDGVSL